MSAATESYRERAVPPEAVLGRIEPGASIFLGTGAAEPRTLVGRRMASDAGNLRDLELIQIVSFGDAISLQQIDLQKYRLKTFFSGWVASEAITAGRVDLIPSRFSRIPRLFEDDRIVVDVALVQVTPPDASGHCSLGVGVDVARLAMERARYVAAEINERIPTTFGDTFVRLDDFDDVVLAEEPPVLFPRWPVDEAFDRVGVNVASVIDDGSCLGFSLGPLFEALAPHLRGRRDLGIHSPFFTDPLMDLVESGAVSNRRKEIFRGKSVASYALGTAELMDWLDRNPRVEFQGIDKVCRPTQVGQNPDFVGILPVRRVDLSGRVALHFGKGNVAAGPGEAIDIVNGAELSPGGKTVMALPSRNLKGEPNIRLSVEDMPNQLGLRELVDIVVTDQGVAALRGRTVRERAQALIEVAHPDDRAELVELAKRARILYEDQIFLPESASLYPDEIACEGEFKDGLRVRFRAIRPSDEEGMRRLFYRFSDQAVYYRYFTSIKTMPHAKMQQYVNVDYRQTLSVVGLIGEPGEGRIIAEGRYARYPDRSVADLAFVVDEQYQRRGIATFLLQLLVRLARERGIQAFHADILASNRAMRTVIEKSGLKAHGTIDGGVYELELPLEP